MHVLVGVVFDASTCVCDLLMHVMWVWFVDACHVGVICSLTFLCCVGIHSIICVRVSFLWLGTSWTHQFRRGGSGGGNG